MDSPTNIQCTSKSFGSNNGILSGTPAFAIEGANYTSQSSFTEVGSNFSRRKIQKLPLNDITKCAINLNSHFSLFNNLGSSNTLDPLDPRCYNIGSQSTNYFQRQHCLQPGKHILRNQQLISSKENAIDTQIPFQSLTSLPSIISGRENEINVNVPLHLPSTSNTSRICKRTAPFNGFRNSANHLDNCFKRLRCLQLGKHILQSKQLTSTNVNVIDSQVPSESLLPSGTITSEGLHEINANIQTHTSLPSGALEGLDDINANIQSQTSLPIYLDVGDPMHCCQSCGAMLWYDERVRRARKTSVPKFSICCTQGKVQLPRLQPPLEYLKMLVFNKDLRESKMFLSQIRTYNSMFSFTSMGGKVDHTITGTPGPFSFKIGGQNYHLIGSLLPLDSVKPKFAQLYIYDTENEVSNRMSAFSTMQKDDGLNAQIVLKLKEMLDQYNPFVKSFRMVADQIRSSHGHDIQLRLLRKRDKDGRMYNLPTTSKVAALIVGDFDTSNFERDIILQTQSGELQRISELHPSYLPLQYPLLFPFGEDGYREDISHSATCVTEIRKRTKVTLREFLAFRLQDRENEISTLLNSQRLLHQFIVDGFTMVESQCLNFIRRNQKQLRIDLDNGLTDAILRGDQDGSSIGKRIILPSSFTGGARYMAQNFQDAMEICKWAGYPDLFLTFTCNTNWPEIQRFVKKKNLKVEDRPDIICRIFKIKLNQLISVLKEKQFFGKVIAVVYTIEFQKRGLPHAHILLFLAPENKCPTPEDIDNIICAEIPNRATNPALYAIVQKFMIHGPCGAANYNSPCMVDGRCSKHFPKRFIDRTTVDENGYPLYRRRDDGNTIVKNRIELDNRFVVPYNPKLLLMFQAHINVESCNQSRSIKYLFKYISKGHDRVTATLYQSNDNLEEGDVIDEIKMFYDCRYVSACEASWRIFAFDIQYRQPAVERLSFHLPNQQPVIFQYGDNLDSIINKPTIHQTMFTAWMQANKEYPEARKLTYTEFPTKFVLHASERKWKPRKNGFSIGRLHQVPPTSGELFYERILLNKVQGPTCFEDIRTVGDIIHPTFRDACYALGLLDDDKEFIEAIHEASHWGSGQYLRSLFVTMLLSNTISRPDIVWEKCWEILSEDALYTLRRDIQLSELQVSDMDLKNFALIEIDKILRNNGRTLMDFPPLPIPDGDGIPNLQNRLILDQLNFDKEELAAESTHLISKMTYEQKYIFDQIIHSTSTAEGGVFFVHGYGGTGKTYIWKALTTALRADGHIVLTVASSGIASILLPGGRTAHSRFAIPLLINEDSTCNIKQGSPTAELIQKTKLIIWDEAVMMNRYCFEAVDKSLRDILQLTNPNSLKIPFGGKAIVLAGDFRQILPVIPKGTRSDIVFAALNSSYLWSYCKVFNLTQNMRLQSQNSSHNEGEVKEFGEWLLNVGEGKINEPNDGEVEIEIPEELLVTDYNDPIAAIISSTYPSLQENYINVEYLKDRAILAPTLEIVEKVNQNILSQLPGEERIYLSSDSVCNSCQDVQSLDDLYTPDFLNIVNCSGLPPHKLSLKIGAPIMLLRNIDQSSGLCNGTRLIVSQLGNHVIEAKVINGSHYGQKVFIPRMNMSPSDSKWPFKLQRRQFPIVISFAMTINKSQGQSLNHVGLYFPKPVFTHGQLYVALSRVTTKTGLKLLIHDKDNQPLRLTKNVVYKEVFQNLS